MFGIISMEYVLRGDPQAGNLLSVTEISFVLLQSLPGRFSSKSAFGIKPLMAPLSSHVTFTLLWSSMSILANYAFAYKISVTIFTLIRSCNIIASVFLGRLVFGQRYTWKQLLCVCAVTVGIFLASMGEAKAMTKTVASAACSDCSDAQPTSVEEDAAAAADLRIWMIGISMLAFVQVLQGFLGHVQAGFYKMYTHLAPKGELCDEYLFTSQLVALVPLFFLRTNISTAAWAALESDPITSFRIPSRVVWLILNCFANMICLKGVFRTSSVVSPLTLTILLSVRKFLSVLVSIFWFRNPWTSWHSFAVVLIFGGAFAYSQAPQSAAESKGSKKNN